MKFLSMKKKRSSVYKPAKFGPAKSKYCPALFGHKSPVITQYARQSAEFVMPNSNLYRHIGLTCIATIATTGK